MGLPERTQDNTIVFKCLLVTVTIQVRTITNSIVTFQSGSALYLRAKLTPAEQNGKQNGQHYIWNSYDLVLV